ncbi:MAG: trypsin-like serine protease [Actinomycetota bacterium]|nr:trypsin-like serine protease [Actinomycetota bacterium]
MADLMAALDATDRTLASASVAGRARIDMRANAIVVEVPNAASFRRGSVRMPANATANRRAAEGLLRRQPGVEVPIAGLVDVDFGDENAGCLAGRSGHSTIQAIFCDPPFRGGVAIRGGGGVCSAGFNVVSRSDLRTHYVLTAGHCASVPHGSGANGEVFETATPSYVWQFGTWWRSVYSASAGDLGIIRMTSPSWWRPDPMVYVADTATAERKTTNVPNYGIAYVRSMSTVGVGDFLCRTGHRSHTDCGEFIGLRRGGVNTSGAVYAEFSGMYMCPGDSGGPVYAHARAYGLAVAKTVSPGSVPTTTYWPSSWGPVNDGCGHGTLVQPFYYRDAQGRLVDTLAAVNVYLMTTKNGYGTY